MHNLSDHSLQFTVIFRIKTSFLLSSVLGKSGTFVQWGYKVLYCVYDVYVPVFQCHALIQKGHSPILKNSTFFSCT